MSLTRRQVLSGGAVLSGAAVLGGVGVVGARGNPSPAAVATASHAERFYGAHQAGIATAPPEHLLFATYDVVATGRDAVADLLTAWTGTAARLAAGRDVGDPAPSASAPPVDTGEAVDSTAGALTLTFGFGPSLFERKGLDRFGLAGRRPGALVALPDFAGDQLDLSRSDGDLCVQACGDDPLVLFHAIRNLTRIGRGTVALRWTQAGFGRTATTTSSRTIPRNLMGFQDGTVNPRAGTDLFDEHVWVAPGDGPDWMTGGSYLVARRIRILVETWDRSSLDDQEITIGRAKSSGALLDKRDPDAHVALASQADSGIHILRRGYNFADGIDERVGQLDAGLFFLAYQRDPRRQFIPLQHKLAGRDRLNEYTRHVGSAVFAVPPGAATGQSIGQALFA